MQILQQSSSSSCFLSKLPLEFAISVSEKNFSHTTHTTGCHHCALRRKFKRFICNIFTYLSCAQQYWNMCYIYLSTAIDILMIARIDFIALRIFKKKITFVKSYTEIEAIFTDMSDFSDQTKQRTKWQKKLTDLGTQLQWSVLTTTRHHALQQHLDYLILKATDRSPSGSLQSIQQFSLGFIWSDRTAMISLAWETNIWESNTKVDRST